MDIGNIHLSRGLILGPMAGVTDMPFRELCREQGCEYTVTEMVSAKAMLYKNRNTRYLLETGPDEHPVAAQLFGSDPQIMAEMGRKIEDLGFDAIDINMGCPVPKVVNNGEGSALMQNPVLAGRIISSLVKAVSIPVTVKIRSGFDPEHLNAVEIARIASDSGASAVAVHGRTRSQYYEGRADWNIIRQVKEAVPIPVVGNGDLLTADDIISMRNQTGCDGFMIARGARGNPWIFGDIIYALDHPGKHRSRPDGSQIYQTIMRHYSMMLNYKPERVALQEMRKHISWYTQGLPSSSRLRSEIMKADSLDQVRSILYDYFEEESK